MSQYYMEPFIYTPLQPGEIRLLYPVTSQDNSGKEVSWSLRNVRLLNGIASPAVPGPSCSSLPLSSCSASSPILFNALSYTWGALHTTFPFILYDGDCQQPLVLQIHSNLHNALPYLAYRASTTNIPIWIDAICINQVDEAEKFIQVRLMHQLYRAAQQVWVWLGDGCFSDDSSTRDRTDNENVKEQEPKRGQERRCRQEAVALLPLIAEAGEALSQRRLYNSVQLHPMYDLPPLYSPVWRFIHALLDNPWFCRLWIVQEVALARRVLVLFGEQEIEWNVLRSAVDRWSSLKRYMKDSVSVKLRRESLEHRSLVFSIRDLVQNQQLWDRGTRKRDDWPIYIVRILCSTASGHHCSDPRDRIYGVLGFLRTKQLEQLKLHDGLSIEELYMHITRFLLSNLEPSKQEFWDLFHLGMNNRRLSEKVEGQVKSRLPSWCPDYHHISGWASSQERAAAAAPQTDLEHLIPRNQRLTPAYAASPLITSYSMIGLNTYDKPVFFQQQKHADQNDEPHKIRVTGRIFDTIKKVYPIYPHTLRQQHDAKKQDSTTTLLAIHAWERALARDILDSPTGGNKQRDHISLEDYWRTLVGNILNTTKYTLTIGMFLKFRETLDTWATTLKSASMATSDSILAADKSPFRSPTSCPSIMEEDRSSIAERPRIGTPEFRIFLRGLATAQTGRRIFTTVDGRLGFGPQTAEVGDSLCVLSWARTPHIIRRKLNRVRNTEPRILVTGENEENIYEVVGQAYIHGMMSGEVRCLGIENEEIIFI
jgi:hypothetical protein